MDFLKTKQKKITYKENLQFIQTEKIYGIFISIQ